MTTYETLRRKYQNHVPAAALFFKNAHNKALRIEAPDIGKEFTDNSYIGRDPEGTLFYHDIQDFSQSGNPHGPSVPVKCVVKQLTDPHSPVAHITFTRQGASKPHAEFIADDPTNAVNAAGMNGYEKVGYWTPLDMGIVNASIVKPSDGDQFKITARAIRKEATIANREGQLDGVRVHVEGHLWFKDINTIKNGKWANYDNDRIVFYENDYTGKDFVAFFIPFENPLITLGLRPNATESLTFQNVTWT